MTHRKPKTNYVVRDVTTDQLGNGCPDVLVIGIDRRTGLRRSWLIEIKMPGATLTADEAQFHQAWQGDVWIVESVAAAETLVGL